MQRMFFTLFWGCFFAAGNTQNKIDVLHYKYNIELNDNNDTIYGKAEITLSAPGFTRNIEFDFTGLNSIRRGMIVDTVKSTRFGHTVIIPPYSDIKPATGFKHSGDKLLLNYYYDRVDNAGAGHIDTIIITIHYHGIPFDGLIISQNKYRHRTFFSDNWPNRAHNWIPCVDDPADKATVEFIVTAPSHYQVISNGVQIAEANLTDNKKMTHWKEEVPLPTKVMVIGVADFAIKQFADSPPGIPVSAWVYPQDSTPGFKNYSAAPAILKFLSDYIGPFPYKKLANVQSKTIFGGMENASAIFYEEGSASSSITVESLLAHEITHQWFGDMASEKNFADLWLSEGFATYFTHIYIESKYGTDSLNKRMKNEREEIIDFVKGSPRPVVDSTTNYMQLLNTNSYQKGGWILHMLRRQLGDTVFKKSIRKYYETYAGKNANTDDLRKIFEAVSGKNLQLFFSQWLLRPVNPSLKITWKYLAKEKKIKIEIEQTQNEPIFNMPLEIEMTFPGNKKVIMPLNITAKFQSFISAAAKKPEKIILDPKVSLLFEGTMTEGK